MVCSRLGFCLFPSVVALFVFGPFLGVCTPWELLRLLRSWRCRRLSSFLGLLALWRLLRLLRSWQRRRLCPFLGVGAPQGLLRLLRSWQRRRLSSFLGLLFVFWLFGEFCISSACGDAGGYVFFLVSAPLKDSCVFNFSSFSHGSL